MQFDLFPDAHEEIEFHIDDTSTSASPRFATLDKDASRGRPGFTGHLSP